MKWTRFLKAFLYFNFSFVIILREHVLGQEKQVWNYTHIDISFNIFFYVSSFAKFSERFLAHSGLVGPYLGID